MILLIKGAQVFFCCSNYIERMHLLEVKLTHFAISVVLELKERNSDCADN